MNENINEPAMEIQNEAASAPASEPVNANPLF